MVAAFLPLIASIPFMSGSPELAPAALVVGMAAAVGSFLSGHNSRLRAVLFALAGGALGTGLAWAIFR